MIKSIIVDDEQNSRDVLEKMIQRYLRNKVDVLAILDNVDNAIDYLSDNSVDLVFLDVKLENQNGLELLHYFSSLKPFEVIFVTGYKDYAIDAVRYSAIDYILKPVNSVDLITAIKRYESKVLPTTNGHSIPQKTVASKGSHSTSDPIENISNKRDSIAFPSKNGFIVEKVSSIIYCEAKGNYSEVHLYTKGEIMISKTLKKLVEMIDHPDFFRIHKSYFINMNYISSYNRSENLVELKNGVYLPVSVRKNESFIKKLIRRN